MENQTNETRAVDKGEKKNCPHKWVPIEFDDHGKTIVSECSLCKKRFIVG